MAESRFKRLLGEFLIIVVGILAALAVDEWREDRAAREVERLYVARLIGDLGQDSATMRAAVAAGSTKTTALDSIIGNLSDPAAIRRSPRLAWPNLGFTYARPELQTTTFDELTSSGRLALIRDEAVRKRIGDHYLSVVHQFDRLDQRRTRLAWRVAELYPGTSWGSAPRAEIGGIDSAFFAAPNSDARLDALLGVEYHGLLNQERIYARSIEEISGGIQESTLDMLQLLRGYASEIR